MFSEIIALTFMKQLCVTQRCVIQRTFVFRAIDAQSIPRYRHYQEQKLYQQNKGCPFMDNPLLFSV